jgi:uncharacterized membrane protein YoaK (UPF0700 family)
MNSTSIRSDYLAHPAHGPLPALLLGLTVSTGVIDAVSIISLGRVFVANMTGNIAFIGFALAGAPGFSLIASVIALGGFLVGAGLGGTVVTRLANNRGVLLRTCTGIQFLLLIVATIIAAICGTPLGDGARDVIVALAAVALGLQNATVRRLAVPDITTTVLTMTITGIAADLRSGNLQVALRRALAVASMLIGALAGALLVLHVNVASALGTATAIVAVVLLGSVGASREPAAWQVGKL